MDISKARFVSQDDFDDAIARNVEAREREVLDYMVADAMLTAALDSLFDAGEWPERLEKYQSMRPDRVAAELDGADLATVNRLQHRDQVQHLLKTNGQECRKAETSLAALAATIPKTRMDAAVTRLKTVPSQT
jgi:hypothetical protein